MKNYTLRSLAFCVALLVTWSANWIAADEPDVAKTEGAAPVTTILRIEDPHHSHLRTLKLSEGQSDSIQLVGPQPSILRAKRGEAVCEFGFNADASLVTIYPPAASSETANKVDFLVAEDSGLLSDGTFVFSALDSVVIGKQAKLESHPGTHRIGFWGNANDYVTWRATLPAGKYRAELVYSRASPTGTIVTISVADKHFPLTLETTGSWYRYRNVDLGEVDVTTADAPIAVSVKVDKIVRGGVMNLKAVILTPLNDTDNQPARSGPATRSQ